MFWRLITNRRVRSSRVNFLVPVCLVAALGLSASYALAPRVIGFVRSATGEPISGVNVIASSDNFTRSDETGRYELDSLGEILEFSAEGYWPVKRLVKPGQGQLDVELESRGAVDWVVPFCAHDLDERVTIGRDWRFESTLGHFVYREPWDEHGGTRYQIIRYAPDQARYVLTVYRGVAWAFKNLKEQLGQGAIEGTERVFSVNLAMIPRTIRARVAAQAGGYRGFQGTDTRLNYGDGTESRLVTDVYTTHAEYSHVPRDIAALFDRILDSMCYDYQPPVE